MAIGSNDTPRTSSAVAGATPEGAPGAATTPPSSSARDLSPLAAAAELNGSLRELAGSYFELVKFESAQAGLRLGQLVGLAFGIVLLLVAAWLFVGWSIAFLLIDRDHAGWFVVAFALANLVLAGALGWWAYRLSRQPLFPATRRQLGMTRAEKSSS